MGGFGAEGLIRLASEETVAELALFRRLFLDLETGGSAELVRAEVLEILLSLRVVAGAEAKVEATTGALKDSPLEPRVETSST